MSTTGSNASPAPSAAAREQEPRGEVANGGDQNLATEPLSTPPKPTESSSEDGIALRAYQIYCERGCKHGHDVEDWLLAKRQLEDRQDSSES